MGAKVRFDRGAWWVVVHHNRRKKRQRIGPAKADRATAENIAKDLNHRIALGLYPPPEEPSVEAPFDEKARRWLADYATTFKPSYERTASVLVKKHLIPHFGSTDLSRITEGDLLAYVRSKLDQGLSRSTIQNGLSIVRRILNIAVREGVVTRNPAAGLGELLSRVDRRLSSEVRVVESWTRDEVERLLAVAHEHEPRFYPALTLLFSTGIRRGELLGLRWEDVDFDRFRLAIRRAIVENQLTTPKSGKGRILVLPPGTAALVLDLLGARRSEQLARGWSETPPWVFCSETGGPLDVRNFSRSWFRVRRRAQKLGVRPFRLHATRHTYASLALASGKSVRWVAEQLGHANPELTLRVYAHVLPSEETDLSAVDFGAAGDAKRPYTAPAPKGSGWVEDADEASPRDFTAFLERETGLEPATPSLGSSCSAS